MPDVFLDTNILVYAFSNDPKAAVAEPLMANGFVVSVQVLNEFANVARRKLAFDWPQVLDALAAIRELATAVHAIDLSTHEAALRLARDRRLSIYDALIVASAIRAGCDVLFTEDMQSGSTVDGIRIQNPFLEAKGAR